MRKFISRLRTGVLSTTLTAFAFLAAPLAGAQAPAAGARQKPEMFKGRAVAAREVLVKFAKSALPENVAHAKAAADVDLERKVGGAGVRLLRSRSKDVESLVRELAAHPDVVYAEPNHIIRASAVPGDPSFAEQWALQNTGNTTGAGAGTQGADIGAASAWEVSTGSRANVVAVVDTGVDSTHPDLAANMWSAPAPFTVNIGGQTIICEAGTHGFNAITKTCNPADEYNHGTHVAGIIGARGDNGVGGAGVNWTASIMDVKFFDAAGNATLADALDAIEFTIQAKQTLGSAANVRVLNASWGWNGESSLALLDQIKRAGQSDMLFVAGAGNGGADRVGDSNDASPFYPASYDAPNVVSVAATDNNDALASFSNYSATRVHLGAPGVLVFSTVMGGGYDYWSGTSMAAPHVSGAAALVLSRCALDTAGLKNTLLMSVDYVPSLGTATATSGRLDAGKAIRTCAAPTPNPTPTPAPSPTPGANNSPAVALSGPAEGATFTAPASITIGANASDADGVVSRVDFYAGPQLVGTDNASPYSFNWGNVAAGTYSLTAVATDDRGAVTTSAPVTVYVNQPPTSRPGGPYGAQAGQSVQLNGGGSSDTDGTISSYRWNFGDGTTGAGAAPAHAYASAGTYTVTLTVTDDRGASATATTTANISAPPAGAAAGTGSTNRLSKWLDGSGTLGDSVITEAGGNVGIGTSAPTGKLELHVPSGQIDMRLTSKAITSPFTIGGALPANLGARFTLAGQNEGGLAAQGFTDADAPAFRFQGHVGSAAPTQFPVIFEGFKSNGGSDRAPLGAGERVFGFFNGAFDAGGTVLLSMLGDGRVGVGTTNPQSTLQVNGYIQLSTISSAPPAADCDAMAEMGRMMVDPVGFKLYVCTAAGWKTATLQ